MYVIQEKVRLMPTDWLLWAVLGDGSALLIMILFNRLCGTRPSMQSTSTIIQIMGLKSDIQISTGGKFNQEYWLLAVQMTADC